MKKKIIIIICVLCIIFLFLLSLIVGFFNKKIDEKYNGKEKIITKINPKSILLKKVSLGDEFSIPIYGRINVDDKLDIEFLNVQDSRCRKNMECVWSGELEYNIRINEDYETISTVIKPELYYKNYVLKLYLDKCGKYKMRLSVERKD